MEEKTIQLIEKLANQLGIMGKDVIHYYSNWYIGSSIVWIIFGGIIIFASRFIKGDKDGEFFDGAIPVKLIRWIVIFVGLLFVCCNLPDLLNPQGIAIHQLLKDLQGK